MIIKIDTAAFARWFQVVADGIAHASCPLSLLVCVPCVCVARNKIKCSKMNTHNKIDFTGILLPL